MLFKNAVHSHRSLLIIVIAVASVLLFYVLLGFLFAPWYAERRIVETLQERLQVAAVVEDIRFNPFTFEASMDGVQLTTEADNSLLDLERLYLNFQPWHLLSRKVRFETLEIVRPQLYFSRFSETDNTFSRLIERWQQSAPPEQADARNSLGESNEPESDIPEEQTETALFPIEFGRFAYIDGSVQLHDEVPETEFNTVLSPVNLMVENFSTVNEEDRGTNELLVTFENDARLRMASNFIVSPLQWDGELSLENFSLLTTWPYFQDTAPFVLERGLLDLTLAYNLTLPAQGLQVLIDAIQLQISQVVAHEGDQPPFVDGGTLTLSNGSIRYPDMTVSAEDLALADLTLRLLLDPEGELNLTRIAGAFGNTGEESEDQLDEETSLRLNLNQFTLRNAHLIFIDRMPATPAQFDVKLDGNVQNLSLASGNHMPVTLSATLASGGNMNLEGQVQVFPDLDLDAQLALEALSLLPVQPYLSEQAKITIDEGQLNATAQVSSNADEALSLEGQASLASLTLHDNIREERLLSWGNLTLANVSVSLAEHRLAIEELTLDEAYARVVITDDANTNFAQVFADENVENVPERNTDDADQVGETISAEQQTGQLFSVSVGRVVINDASSDFMDQNLPIVFDAHMQTLNGGFSDFTTTSEKPTELSLQGQVDEFGQVTIDGAVNPLNFGEYTTVNLRFSNIDLAATSPYVIKFAGRQIDAGSADLDLRYEIREGALDALNNVVIRNIELGEKINTGSGALDLPLDLAVALLENSKGIIDLDIPVSGSINDPQFELGPIIRGAIANAISKIVTSPFRFLGNLIGGDEEKEEFSGLGFRPGSSDLEPSEQQKLMRLSEALNQRPQLSLLVPSAVAESADRVALQESSVDAQVEEALAAGDTGALNGDGPPQRDNPSPQEQNQSQPAGRRIQVLEELYRRAGLSPALETVRRDFFPTQETPNGACASGDINCQPGSTDEKPEAQPRTGLFAILSFDDQAYMDHLQERLAQSEMITSDQLQALGEARQQAIVDFIIKSGDLDPSRVQKEDAVKAEVENNRVMMEFDLGV